MIPGAGHKRLRHDELVGDDHRPAGGDASRNRSARSGPRTRTRHADRHAATFNATRETMATATAAVVAAHWLAARGTLPTHAAWSARSGSAWRDESRWQVTEAPLVLPDLERDIPLAHGLTATRTTGHNDRGRRQGPATPSTRTHRSVS